MKNIILFCFIVGFLSSSCEKRFNNPVANKYVIEGQLYEGYNFKAINDFPLELVYYELNGRDERVAQKVLDTYTTEGDGYFRFRYSRLPARKSGFILIQQDESKREQGQAVVSAPMLKGISLNTDQNRSVCLSSQGKLEVILHYSELENDSFLFSRSSFRQALNVDFVYLSGLDRFPSHWGLVLDKEEQQRVFAGITKWDGDLSKEHFGSMKYGLGRKDYEVAFHADRLDSIDNEYQRIQFDKSGFPYIDTVHIDLD